MFNCAGMRMLLHILSALLIVVTSQAYASARMAEEPAGQMVICVGNTIIVTLIDADGNPMDVPHVCPEATLLAAAVPAPSMAVHPGHLVLLDPPTVRLMAHPTPQIAATARAPPVLV
ncbi:MAG: hypothetical protein AAGM84_11230 [Pseudomonadota bacterium]